MAPDVTEPGDPAGDKVRRRAREMLDGGSEGQSPASEEAAERMAARLLEDSEERTLDPAARDPADDDVIRRSSEETT
jgi:hypothetical protein